jgi:transcriptional regulator with XRE-family HTH domain
MTSRERPRDRALDKADRAVADLGRQVRLARRGAGLSIRAAAAAVGLDPSTFGRIERGELENVTIRQVALACASVGHDLSIRSYLRGDPARDAGQRRLLERFRVRLPPGAPWATEVPMPIPGDLRGLDGWTRLAGSSIGVEAETRLTDVQALERKILLKARDADLDLVILLVAETRANRAILEIHREALRTSFRLDTREVMAAIERGIPPRANGIVVL